MVVNRDRSGYAYINEKKQKQVEKNECSINNVFPLRTDIIAKHIRIDTTTLVHLLMTKKQGNKTEET